jgi:hypothetical protein
VPSIYMLVARTREATAPVAEVEGEVDLRLARLRPSPV